MEGMRLVVATLPKRVVESGSMLGFFFLSFVFFFTTLGSSLYALTSKANFSIFCGEIFELLDCIFC
jgi:hypothetical protein